MKCNDISRKCYDISPAEDSTLDGGLDLLPLQHPRAGPQGREQGQGCNTDNGSVLGFSLFVNRFLWQPGIGLDLHYPPAGEEGGRRAGSRYYGEMAG
jgi:hypothetical protein